MNTIQGPGKPVLGPYIVTMAIIGSLAIGLGIWFQTRPDPRDHESARFWIGSGGIWGILIGSAIVIFGVYFVKLSTYNFLKLNIDTLEFFSVMKKVAQDISDKLDNVTNIPKVVRSLKDSLTSTTATAA